MSILPAKNLELRQRETPLGVILRWDFVRQKDTTPFSDAFNSLEFGGNYLYPEKYMLPDNARLYLFRRVGNPITDEDIDEYFNSGPGDDNPEEIRIIDPDINKTMPRKLTETKLVFRGITIYYALVIQDWDTKEYSSKIDNNITIT